jgi:acetyl-CoA C-acetyltransferase
MAPRDPRAPVIVGGGQLTSTDPAESVSPLAMMAAAARAAISDSGGDLLGKIDSVGTVDCLSWRAGDPAAALAEELGIRPQETVGTHTSGTSPFDLLADACLRISSGTSEVVLLAGGEAVRALRAGRYSGGPEQPAGTAPDRRIGTDRTPTHPGEDAAGLKRPAQFYPLFEHALRAEAGRDQQSHERWLGRLWSGFASVASANPHAVVRSNPDSSAIVEVSDANRMVASPYRKLMTANIYTDQAAAIVVCSAGAAAAAGIPEEHWVYVHGTGAAQDHWHVGERAELQRSPAVRAIGSALLAHLGSTIEDIGYLDLYSCFPCAVQIAARELGVDLESRQATLTGGLSFAGGPASNYAMHSLATALPLLRADPSGTALCTGVGWFMTKHAAAVLAARPPERPYRHVHPQSEVDAQPARKISESYHGVARIETYTVTYDRASAPEAAFVSCLLPDGSRAFAGTTEPVQVAELAAADPIGASVTLSGTGKFELSG